MESTGDQKGGSEAYVPRKGSVRLKLERSLETKVKRERSGGRGSSRRRGAWGPGRRREERGRGALTGPMTHTMRSRSSRE